jgi:chorismate mutase/prephenate dehydratase
MAAERTIEALDRQLVELLGERVRLMREAVSQTLPSPAGLAPEVPSAAAVQVDPQAAANSGLPAEKLTHWLRHGASICEQVVGRREPIVFLGPIYSYSYLAAVKHFGMAAELVPVTTIAAAFDELVRGQAKYGVVPIENSTDGRVVDTLGMFARWPVQICGEVLLPVHHCLLGRCSRAEVTVVQSKPQALSQCRNWLAQHVPDARLVECASTATAAALAAQTYGTAAIASLEAGLHHGLQVIDQNIEDNSQNITRFAVIGHRPSAPTGSDKTSLMFQIHHQPGALAAAMVAFQKSNVNLTWIESFPLPNCPNEYLFFVELEGHQAEEPVAAALRELGRQTRRLEILGSYRRG